MQIPSTFTTISQRPFHLPQPGINRFKPFYQTKHFSIHFHFLTQSSVVKAITAHQEEAVIVESNISNNEPRFIDIGFVSGVHSFQGDVRVKPNTDFPEQRFSTPGRRWLKQKVMGGESVQEIELQEGREHSGQNCWVLKFTGVDSVEECITFGMLQCNHVYLLFSRPSLAPSPYALIY